MAHQRDRIAGKVIREMAAFWPVIGILGLRQVGKSTLLRDQMKIAQYLTLDDEDVRMEAEKSSKTFISRFAGIPTVIDEVQKVPNIFDAIKSNVDRKRIPGRWFLSGSVAFSGKIGIRESLTGRIGLLHLFPMCLAELYKKGIINFDSPQIIHKNKSRFDIETFSNQMHLGGLPIPAFIRDEKVRSQYWQNWLETTIVRDAQKSYGKNFDPDYCMSIIRMLAKALPEGEYPSLKFIKGDKRKALRYINALQEIFFLRKFSVHEEGVGTDHWIFGDSGLASYLSPEKHGAGVLLSIARHAVFNEIFCYNEYLGHPVPRIYYKSARGSVVDLVWNNIPIRIIAEVPGGSRANLNYFERSLQGAMKALRSKQGILVTPSQIIDLKKSGISVVPWTYWS